MHILTYTPMIKILATYKPYRRRTKLGIAHMRDLIRIAVVRKELKRAMRFMWQNHTYRYN